MIIKKIFKMLLFSSAINSLFGQDCDAILEHVKNELDYEFSSMSNYEYTKWLNSVSFRKFLEKRDRSFTFTVPLGKTGLIFGGGGSDNKESFSKLQEAVDQGVIIRIDQEMMVKSFESVVDSDVLKSWERCIEMSKSGKPYGSVELLGNNLVNFKITYIPIASDDLDPIITSDPILKGGDFLRSLKKGDKISLGTREIIVKRKPGSSILFQIETSRGSISLFSEHKEKNENQKSLPINSFILRDLLGFGETGRRFNTEWDFANDYINSFGKKRTTEAINNLIKEGHVIKSPNQKFINAKDFKYNISESGRELLKNSGFFDYSRALNDVEIFILKDLRDNHKERRTFSADWSFGNEYMVKFPIKTRRDLAIRELIRMRYIQKFESSNKKESYHYMITQRGRQALQNTKKPIPGI